MHTCLQGFTSVGPPRSPAKLPPAQSHSLVGHQFVSVSHTNGGERDRERDKRLPEMPPNNGSATDEGQAKSLPPPLSETGYDDEDDLVRANSCIDMGVLCAVHVCVQCSDREITHRPFAAAAVFNNRCNAHTDER